MNRRVVVFMATLAVATLVVLGLAVETRAHPPGESVWWTLPLLTVGMVAAENLRVKFRRGDNVASNNLFEATLAPVLFTFSPVVVVAAVALAQGIAGLILRRPLIKGAFGVVQWTLAAALGGLLLWTLADGQGVTLQSLGALVIALAVVAVVNYAAILAVMTIASGQTLRAVLRGLKPILLTGWVGGWLVNLLIGLLFVLGAAGHPSAVLLFPVPLFVLHLAYRGYAAARADRTRLAGLRAAAQVLTEPLHPLNAIDSYLTEVARCFESRAAGLILVTGDTFETHLLVRRGPELQQSDLERRRSTDLEVALARQEDASRLTDHDSGEIAETMGAAQWRDCLCAPLLDDQRRLGAVVVFDQAGLEGTATADVAVIEALARETAHTIARGRLLESVMEERRKLGQIVSTASDGIFTLAEHGTVLSWNAACEGITGLTAQEVLGRPDAMRLLDARTPDGDAVDFARWTREANLPREFLITRRPAPGSVRRATGDEDAADPAAVVRRLSCSWSETREDSGRAPTLVVVARDITPADEYEALQAQFNSLVEQEKAQRFVVHHLQQAVAPVAPELEGSEMSVAYVASDSSSPTGGDLYDWHLLPSGELHVAVVDVLGHGVVATRDALTVIHTLRLVAVEGTPLDQVVARADELLNAQESELVATVVVARYHPVTGALRVVSGGHPPALVVGPDGVVLQLSATGGAIGWPAVGSDNVVTTQLGRNESLVLYTDGLIEARKNILDGMDDLVRHAGDVSMLPAEEFADELVARSLKGADRRDDSLALVLRRTAASQPLARMRWEVGPGDRAGIRAARHGLMAWLTDQDVEVDDPVLVAAELLANAVVVARSTAVLSVTLDDEGDRVVLEVADDGDGTAPVEITGWRLPPTDSERGRGLYLVRALSDEVSTTSSGSGTVVRCVIRLRRSRTTTVALQPASDAVANG
ncbi:MAG: SpoIIE family protein phosphatase [Actinomycetota bacterium]|nr:SpoIIE family protein phosphatase [Actinomycetota bacterium]